jgi:hypothetical protein
LVVTIGLTVALRPVMIPDPPLYEYETAPEGTITNDVPGQMEPLLAVIVGIVK